MSAERPLSGTGDVGAGGRSVTVLVADDNDVALRLCRRVLEKAGYKVLTATDGLDAVSVALANSPDVILMDVAMPGIDGLEATRRIKQQTPGVAIVIASVLATESNRERFLASGADDVLMPPFRLSDMIAAIARLTANRGSQSVGHAAAAEHDHLGENPGRQFREPNRIGIALSAERDALKLQDTILTTMRRLTNADSASLWLKTVGDDGQPKLFLSASQDTSIEDPYQAFNVPVDEKTVVGHAVTTGTSQIYDDAYSPPSGKPQARKGFDARHGYRTKSMLTVLMRNFNNEVVGAVQLINAKRRFETKLTVENVPDEVVSFRGEDLELIESIANQAAIAIDNRKLLDSIESLFDGFARTSLSALELRDPSAAGHSYRVEALTMSLARAVSGLEVGRYRDVRLTEDQFKELRYACLLHDVGLIGVREHILIKSKKLLPDQLEVIQARFEFLVRSVQVKFATEKIDAMRNGKSSSQRLEDIDRRLAQEIDQLHRWMAAIVQANEPSVLSEETASILDQLSKQTYQDLSGTSHPMLDPQECGILSIRKGVLGPQEQLEMESHVTHSFELVNSIPWPPSMRSVPEIVFSHHEKLDGSGYPRGLAGDQISLQARMITIADIYDALTAQDRPYKRGVPTAVALDILRAEANEGKLDKDLLDVFVSKQVFLAVSGQRSAAAESSGTADAGGGGRSVTVLVADDNDVALRLCRHVLEKAGHKVLTASDGLEAVALALANSPDVILLDHAMPGMDSLEAMRQIRQRRPGIAIVIASMLAAASDRERYLVAGADDVLIKPFRLNDLIAVVAKLTANRGPQMKDDAGTRLGSHEIVEQLDTDVAQVSESGGYGTLDALLHDQSVSEIMVNGADEVFIERRGIVTKAKVRFDDQNQLLETIQRLVATTGQHIDVENPIVEAYLPDGSRVNAIIPPASNRGPALTIRKFAITVLTMDDLMREGGLSPAMAEFLEAAVLGRLNILVSGAAGSGKTATLNVLARFVPHNQRLITIEEGPELQIGHPHVVSLLHRPVDADDEGEPTIRQLLHQGTRMLPNRILFGEVRGAEAIDLLEAMNTGRDGSMSTICSNSARDALSRLETMVRMASIDMPLEAVRAQIASAVNLVVHQVRTPDGRRKIAQIADVVGYDASGAILRDIFVLGMGSDLRLEYNATGYVPTSLDKAAFYGVQVNQDLFDPVKSRFVPARSDMMPVVKDPLMSGQHGSGGENVVRQVVVVPFSSNRPAAAVPMHSTDPASTMLATSAMREEMSKLIDAARSAVADLQAAISPPTPQPPASAEVVPPLGIPEPATTASTPETLQEMGKLIDAARAAIADLQVDDPAQGGASPGPKASKR